MAAPSGTVWGSIVNGSSSGRKGRLGIYVGVTDTNTQRTVNVQVWFWTIYSCSDGAANTLYYNAGTSVTAATSVAASNIDITHTVASGEGWNTANQTRVLNKTYTYDKGTSATTYKVYAKFSGIDMLNGAVSANTTYTVPALASYTISYNANGGSGAPSSQTKYYGKSLTLSNSKPTRAGYSFQGWATSASGSVAYAAGASYTANAGATLYAVWQANTYTVKYDANGGTGAPGNQTKTYGTTLKLSSTKPTRTNYTFLGWATSASATTVSYAAGANYTANAAVTLYAVWELAYVSPIIYNLTVWRCDVAGNPNDDGISANVTFEYECTYSPVTVHIEATSASRNAEYDEEGLAASGDFGYILDTAEPLSTEETYTFTITVSDSGGSSNAKVTLNGSVFPIDAKAGGDGVSFGKPAELGKAQSLGGKGVADFAYDAKFNQPVYGNVLGLNRLPEIPANSDLNDYMETGCWAIRSNAIAATITCGGKKLGTDNTVPPARACRFEVSSSTGEGIRSEQWSYLRQKFMPYNDQNPIWERDIARGEDNVWRYYEWWKSNLTPAASKKVYHEQKVLWGADMETGMYMTSGHTATLAEKISDQPNGIVLVFCYYNGASDTNWGWIARYVPKIIVELEPGAGHTFELTNGKFGSVGTKYLYLNDDRIVGHADNNLTGTAGSGITYANNKFVLRYVIGV